MLAPTRKVRYNNVYQYFCIGCHQGNRVTVKSCDYSFSFFLMSAIIKSTMYRFNVLSSLSACILAFLIIDSSIFSPTDFSKYSHLRSNVNYIFCYLLSQVLFICFLSFSHLYTYHFYINMVYLIKRKKVYIMNKSLSGQSDLLDLFYEDEIKKSSETFSSRLKQLRSSLGMTQVQFAEHIHTTQTTLSSYENLGKSPSLDVAITIAKECNVSIDWLCGLSETKSINGTITTYSDLFRSLVKILEFSYTLDDNSLVPIIQTIHYEHSNAPLSFEFYEDTNCRNFIVAWIKMFKLLNDKTIERDLYELWLEKEYSKYNRPINGCPF